MNDFYVYILVRPLGEVFYVGKGRGPRIDQHEQEAEDGVVSLKCDIIRGIWAQGEQILKKKLYCNLSEDDALAIEAIFIHLFDRANLANRQSGHAKALPKGDFTTQKIPKPKPRKIIGYKTRSYEKNGLFYREETEPIYADEVS
jgi:hypothetical protein